jgi:hypothetical protein
MGSLFVPRNASTHITTGSSSTSGNMSSVGSADIAEIKNELVALRAAVSSSAVVNDVEELKKFTEFLKFRIDSLDGRLAAVEKSTGDLVSKVNMMEISITALSAVLKKPASE